MTSSLSSLLSTSAERARKWAVKPRRATAHPLHISYSAKSSVGSARMSRPSSLL